MELIVINGLPGSGKTLFVQYCKEALESATEQFDVLTTSAVEPIKEIATQLGWDGEKNFEGRRFLSDIKDALDDYSSFTYDYIDSLANLADFVFIDLRSTYDIVYAALTYNATTVFINNSRNPITEFSNHADEDTMNSGYDYDYYIDNNSTKEHLKSLAQEFVVSLILE